jgi:putative ABC transport system permease protein
VTALGLAALGLYGLVSYSVASRTREIATRLALGATPSALQVSVLKEGLTLTGAGVGLGLAATLALGRLVDGLWYRTSGGDPAVLGALVALMAVVAAMACYVPARRAMRIEPTAALRAE